MALTASPASLAQTPLAANTNADDGVQTGTTNRVSGNVAVLGSVLSQHPAKTSRSLARARAQRAARRADRMVR